MIAFPTRHASVSKGNYYPPKTHKSAAVGSDIMRVELVSQYYDRIPGRISLDMSW